MLNFAKNGFSFGTVENSMMAPLISDPIETKNFMVQREQVDLEPSYSINGTSTFDSFPLSLLSYCSILLIFSWLILKHLFSSVLLFQ